MHSYFSNWTSHWNIRTKASDQQSPDFSLTVYNKYLMAHTHTDHTAVPLHSVLMSWCDAWEGSHWNVNKGLLATNKLRILRTGHLTFSKKDVSRMTDSLATFQNQKLKNMKNDLILSLILIPEHWPLFLVPIEETHISLFPSKIKCKSIAIHTIGKKKDV